MLKVSTLQEAKPAKPASSTLVVIMGSWGIGALYDDQSHQFSPSCSVLCSLSVHSKLASFSGFCFCLHAELHVYGGGGAIKITLSLLLRSAEPASRTSAQPLLRCDKGSRVPLTKARHSSLSQAAKRARCLRLGVGHWGQ